MLKFFTDKHNIILLIISFVFFMESLDTTIINTAIPAMSRSLHVNPIDLKIALISYLLSLAIFIPISGWIADKFGIKKVFITAIGVFTMSSLWCGFTHNLYELVIARFLQGLGGSLTIPVGRLIIVRTFKRHELIVRMNQVIIVAAMGMMLGPVFGGVITHVLSWPWIFWVNIPVGLMTMLLAKHWLTETTPHHVMPLDKLGFVLFGGGLATLTFGLSSLSESNVPSIYALSIIAIAITLLIFYTLHSRTQKNPIIKTQLLASRTFRISVTGNLMARLGFGGVPFLIPLLLQINLGYSAPVSGLLLAPIALGIVLVKPFSLFLLRQTGYKKLLIFNTFLVGFSLWTFSLISKHTPIYAICCLTFVFGFLNSIQYSSMNSLAYADITPENLSAATSIMSTIQQLAQSFGVAMGAILIRFFSLGSSEHFALTGNVFHRTFVALGFITFLAALIFLQLKSDDGHELTDRPVEELQ